MAGEESPSLQAPILHLSLEEAFFLLGFKFSALLPTPLPMMLASLLSSHVSDRSVCVSSVDRFHPRFLTAWALVLSSQAIPSTGPFLE